MVYSYLQYLERVSDRVKLEVLGRTYESKPFVSATISSAYNIKNLDLINKAHLKEIEGLGSAQVDGLAESGASGLASSGGLPVVNWLGYSVHGNEASGVNASVVVAYVLVACEDDYIKNILDNSVVSLGSGSSGRGSLDSTKISYAYGLTNSRFNPFNGVILESKIDLTHPLAIGFKDSSLPIFKRSTLVVESVRNPFSVFSRIGKLSGNRTPLLSGYMTPPVVKMVNGTPYVISQRGLLFFPDNPNFRGYWLGTARTFMNAIFFRELL